MNKLYPDDEGEIAIKLGTQDNNVFIDFGKRVHWVGFPRNQAIELAHLILKVAATLPPEGH